MFKNQLNIKYHLIFIIIVHIFILGILHPGIESIETYRKKDKPAGTYFNVNLDSFILDKQNNIAYLNAGLDIITKFSNNIFFVFNKFNFAVANNEKLLNNGYNHFRYNRILSEKFIGEIFFQTEYSEISKVLIESSLGFGPILNILDRKKISISTSLQYLLEIERLNHLKGLYYYNRLSTYISCTILIFNKITLNSSTSYMPRVVNFNDYKIISDISLSTTIKKLITLKILYSFIYDTKPPAGVETFRQFVKPDITLKLDFYIKKKSKEEKEKSKIEKEQKKENKKNKRIEKKENKQNKN